MLDHPIHAINQRETMVSQATDVLKHEHDAILMAIKILDQISDEARQGNATSTDVTQFLGFLREFADTCHHGKEEGLLFPAMIEAGLSADGGPIRSEEHTSELQSLMRTSYAVFSLKKTKRTI